MALLETYISSREQLAKLYRKQAAHRKSLHGRQVNRILALGNVIKMEGLSYRAFQKMFGKSVGFRGRELRCVAPSQSWKRWCGSRRVFDPEQPHQSSVPVRRDREKAAVATLACVRLWRGANPAGYLLGVAGPLCGEQ